MNWTMIMIETAALVLIFTAAIMIPLVKNPVCRDTQLDSAGSSHIADGGGFIPVGRPTAGHGRYGQGISPETLSRDPLPLKGGGGFRNLISERSDEEIIICKNDRHLCFWAGIYCSQPEEGWQEASVTTVVKFNNFLGKIYFIRIWVFHKVLVKSLFSKAIKSK